MNDSLKAASSTIFTQLIDFLTQLPDSVYTQSLPLLSGNTIGKHFRHIIEFYECLVNDLHTGLINYDTRNRNTQLEIDRTFCIERLQCIASLISSINADKQLSVQVCFSPVIEPVKIDSSLTRELLYTMEHTIHHMAIIKMAIQSINFPIEFSQNFGVAFSTIQSKTSAYCSAS
ncbi:DinB family protein [Rhodocytophaga aerolata]|uniref:DinB family protein n=1 Tax=Rhodocytophaga aerolata TaxID=455078 RepID=A0ABT8R225_9BACT|nr:DinB family protein [Rhodocytophaga aerolata]MDO1446150.1 DinB family protein [Rhodocytophaga aerolata]